MRLVRYDTYRPSKGQRNGFDCGEVALNRWLATQAGQSMASHDAVTYLLIDDSPNREAAIAGFYCLSAGEVRREAAPASVAKHAPKPIPVIRMGRFAIDRGYQARGLGAQLLRESLTSALAAANLIGSRAMLVDAINDTAKAFYQRYGFIESPIHPMQLLISLRVVAKSTGIET